MLKSIPTARAPYTCFLKTASGILILFMFMNVPSMYAMDNEEIPGEPVPTKEDLKIGERLFYGLLPLGREARSCASCHNVASLDTFNWNPSAVELAEVYKEKTQEAFSSVIMNPMTSKLSEAHAGYELNDQQLFRLKVYMDTLAEEGPPGDKPVISNLLLFIGMILLILLALADLIAFRKIKYKLVHMVVILTAGLFVVKTLAHEAIAIGRSLDYEPSQPIKFSHYIHATENQTDCLYCHSISEYSKSAGIPSANVCMNCHVIVREGTHSGRWEINKIVNAYENDLPIKWIRVHALQDHVFFSHAQHVTVGNLECQECHGEVEQMTKVKQVVDLSMGWCLDCHRTHEINVLDNQFYSMYEQLHEDLKTGKIPFATADMFGGSQCMKCHY
jgi:cytochrome c553